MLHHVAPCCTNFVNKTRVKNGWMFCFKKYFLKIPSIRLRSRALQIDVYMDVRCSFYLSVLKQTYGVVHSHMSDYSPVFEYLVSRPTEASIAFINMCSAGQDATVFLDKVTLSQAQLSKCYQCVRVLRTLCI